MRAVIQRVSYASVTINNEVKSQIKNGLLILLGVEGNDNEKDIDWLVRKIVQMRIFSDVDGRYLGMDKKVHNSEGFTPYTVFSLWDTYRAWHPQF